MSLINPSDRQIEQRENEGIIILDLRGKLVLGPEDVALRQRLQQLRESGHLNVILNMNAVTEVDSSALGTLIFCSTKFREAGGRLVLLHLAPEHIELSNTVRLNTAFDIYPDELTAVNSFYPDRAVPHYDVLEFVEGAEREQHSAELDTKKTDDHDQTRRKSQQIPK